MTTIHFKEKDPRDRLLSSKERQHIATLLRRRDFLYNVIAQEGTHAQNWDKSEAAALNWIVERVRKLTALADEVGNPSGE